MVNINYVLNKFLTLTQINNSTPAVMKAEKWLRFKILFYRKKCFSSIVWCLHIRSLATLLTVEMTLTLRSSVGVLFVLGDACGKGISHPMNIMQSLDGNRRCEHSNLVIKFSDHIMPAVDKVETSDESDTTHSNSWGQRNLCGGL
jgi:hypothetical protein